MTIDFSRGIILSLISLACSAESTVTVSLPTEPGSSGLLDVDYASLRGDGVVPESFVRHFFERRNNSVFVVFQASVEVNAHRIWSAVNHDYANILTKQRFAEGRGEALLEVGAASYVVKVYPGSLPEDSGPEQPIDGQIYLVFLDGATYPDDVARLRKLP